jgi:hypothetical protein
VPAMPMARPTSDSLRAGASLVPSPAVTHVKTHTATQVRSTQQHSQNTHSNTGQDHTATHIKTHRATHAETHTRSQTRRAAAAAPRYDLKWLQPSIHISSRHNVSLDLCRLHAVWVVS